MNSPRFTSASRSSLDIAPPRQPRRLASLGAFLVTLTALSACGQARLAAPPEPEFTAGERAQPTLLPAPSVVTRVGAIDPASIEPDIDIDAGVPSAVGPEIDLDDMVIIDDAGNISPNLGYWQRFDETLANRLIGADSSAAVALMIDGQLVHSAAYGERVPGSGEATELGDRFRIASISKTITAIVTMQLVDDGVLALDEPVGQRLIDYLALPQADADVPSTTVRELLSHTAGFPKHESTFFSNGATSCVDAATQGLSGSVSSGNSYLYSNMSYCVLGLLIESVTGKTYERVVNERLLTPLGIGGMRLTSTYELGPDEVSHYPTPNRNFMETLSAAGSWNATPADLVTIINSIDPNTDGWKALSPDSMAVMRYSEPSDEAPAGYGLGIINYDGDSYGHTGTIQNTHAMVLVQPDGLTWAITVAGEYPSSTGQLRNIMRSALTASFS